MCTETSETIVFRPFRMFLKSIVNSFGTKSTKSSFQLSLKIERCFRQLIADLLSIQLGSFRTSFRKTAVLFLVYIMESEFPRYYSMTNITHA